MGGYVAFALFRHAPRYFQGLVLADTRSQADTPEAVEGRKRLLAVVQEKGPAAVADEMIPKLLGETTRRENPALVEQCPRPDPVELVSGDRRRDHGAHDAAGFDAAPRVHSLPDADRRRRRRHADASRHEPRSAARHRRLRARRDPSTPDISSSLEQPAAFNAELARFLDHRV